MIVAQTLSKWVVSFSLLICLAVGTVAADRQDLEGTWYGEIRHDGEYDGVQYDERRWITVNKQDGTGQTFMRYYSRGRFQTESIENFTWDIQNDVYWVECTSLRNDNGLHDCTANPRTIYTVQVLDNRQFQYRSDASGRSYIARRVPQDFAFPR